MSGPTDPEDEPRPSTVEPPPSSLPISSELPASSGALSAAGIPRPGRLWHALLSHGEPVLFDIACATLVLLCARFFYRSLHAQTGSDWSAPLDDTFIHFDFARQAARGHPFQWSPGNGYSSGGSSLTYPLVLAVGYALGFREGNGGTSHLMQWAAFVAIVSVFAFLRVASRLAVPLGRWARLFVPAAVLSVGALDWSLWSGMETAWLLALWALLLSATLLATGDLPALHGPEVEAGPPRALPWFLLPGAAGALLVLTRPEAAVCVAAFAGYAAVALFRARRSRAALLGLAAVGLPGALAAVGLALVNRRLTGEWLPAGAITKLVWSQPYLTAEGRWHEYLDLLRYSVLRLTQHHFADVPPGHIRWGWLVPLVAAIPLGVPKLRRFAALLWVQVLGWILLVAVNGQVRFQNERYLMPAVAWLFVLFALGVAVLFSRTAGGLLEAGTAPLARAQVAVRAAAGGLAVVAYLSCQLPRFWEQAWFFGRASRNIRDQQVTVGKTLARIGATRILVGDAGAIPFASDVPSVDLLGLGGYRDYPFARASLQGVGASLELIEKMPASDRPDVIAIYPRWFGDLGTIFGRRLFGVTAPGNVICGDAEKVVYRAEWDALDRQGLPFTLERGEVVADELDLAFLPDERSHGYNLPRSVGGAIVGGVVWRVLPHPRDKGLELFDAGRHVPRGEAESFVLRPPTSSKGRLVLRTVADGSVKVTLRVEGVDADLGEELIPSSRGWVEVSFPLPKGLPSPMRASLHVSEGELDDYHLWIVDTHR